MTMKIFIVGPNGERSPVPANTILLEYTGDLENRKPIFSWLNLKLFSVPYGIENPDRLFNLLIRVGQFGEQALLYPGKLLSVDGLKELLRRASHTHVAYYPGQAAGDKAPPLIDILLPEDGKQATLVKEPMWDIDREGLAIKYQGPYPKLFGEISSSIIHSLAEGNVTYNLHGALATVFPKSMNHSWNGTSLKRMYVNRVKYCFDKGWGEDDLGPVSAYCVQPLLLTTLFALTSLARMFSDTSKPEVASLLASEKTPESVDHAVALTKMIKALELVLHVFDRFPTPTGLAQVLLGTGLFSLERWIKEEPKPVKAGSLPGADSKSEQKPLPAKALLVSGASSSSTAETKKMNLRVSLGTLPPVESFLATVGLFSSKNASRHLLSSESNEVGSEGCLDVFLK